MLSCTLEISAMVPAIATAVIKASHTRDTIPLGAAAKIAGISSSGTPIRFRTASGGSFTLWYAVSTIDR